MKYVLDASVALKWVLSENDSAIAIDLRAGFIQQTHELIAPDVFPAECGHGLIRAERRSIINSGDAIAHLADILTTLPILHSSLPLTLRAADLATQTHASFYDCLYVALAEQQHCEMITADEKLARALPSFPLKLLSSS